MSGCSAVDGSPGGVNTVAQPVLRNTGACSSSNMCGVKSVASSNAVAPILAWNVCRWVDNSGTNSIFVPFNSSTEWSAFLANHPGHISLTNCAYPASVTGYGSTYTIPAPYNTCSTATVNTPTVYGRALTSRWPATAFTPTFICHGGGTTVTSKQQWVGDNVATPTHGQLTWTLSSQFSPDLTFTATNTGTNQYSTTNLIITDGETVRLSFITPGTSGNPINWNGTSGTTVQPHTTTTYSISSTDNLTGLASVASVTVTVNGVGACGSANGQSLASAPTGTMLCGSGSNVGNFAANASGWSWKCTASSSGGTAQNCSASLQSAQCGTDVRTDGNGNITSGTPCAAGSASAIALDGTYSCTTGDINSAASNTVNCSADIPQTLCSWSSNSVVTDSYSQGKGCYSFGTQQAGLNECVNTYGQSYGATLSQSNGTCQSGDTHYYCMPWLTGAQCGSPALQTIGLFKQTCECTTVPPTGSCPAFDPGVSLHEYGQACDDSWSDLQTDCDTRCPAGYKCGVKHEQASGGALFGCQNTLAKRNFCHISGCQATAPQCGTPIFDSSGNLTSGKLCAVGTTFKFDPVKGEYDCSLGSSTVNCKIPLSAPRTCAAGDYCSNDCNNLHLNAANIGESVTINRAIGECNYSYASFACVGSGSFGLTPTWYVTSAGMSAPRPPSPMLSLCH